MRLKDKVAIITGIGSGLGRTAALLFAKEGASVIGCDINDEAGAETIDLARKQGHDAVYVHCDASSEHDVREMVIFAVKTYGKLDILYNNAGISGPFTSSPDISEEEWDRTQAINLKSVFLCCKHAIPELIKQPTSSIISTASMAALLGGAFDGVFHLDAYSASKGGIVAFSRSIAAAYGLYGLRSNVICPGYIETSLSGPIIANSALNNALIARTPLRRWGRPEDVAYLALFLASDESVFLTGATIPIDGGVSCAVGIPDLV